MSDHESKTTQTKFIPIQEDLFTIPSSPSEEPHLTGSRCKTCGEVIFPKQLGCPNCCTQNVEQILLGPKGKLFSFTNVNHSVPEGYKGPIPYGVGLVELPEGAIILAHLTESDPRRLRVGMELTLIIDKLFTDEEGNDIIGFKFKPL